MVLNRDYENDADYSLALRSASNVYKVSKQNGEQQLVYKDTKLLLGTLRAGELALYRIQPAEEEPYTVEYYLDKSEKT